MAVAVDLLKLYRFKMDLAVRSDLCLGSVSIPSEMESLANPVTLEIFNMRCRCKLLRIGNDQDLLFGKCRNAAGVYQTFGNQ